MFASSKLSLHQTQQILEDLNSLHTLFQTQETVFLGSNRLATAPSHTARQKIYNYLSSWAGWSQNLCYLPPLVDKVAAFIRSNEGKVDTQKVLNAIAGLGILLNNVKEKPADQENVELAIVKLSNAVGLETLSLSAKAQQPGLGQYLWQSTKPYLQYISVPTIVNYAIANMWKSKPLVLNNIVKESPFREEIRQIKKCIYFKIEKNNEESKNAILSLLADKEINGLTKYEFNGKSSFAPTQFFADCARMNSLKVNGKEIYSNNSEQVSSLFEELVGTPLFHRLGGLVHQSCQADSLTRLYFKIMELPNFYAPSHSAGYHFDITMDKEKVTVNASLVMQLFTVDEGEKQTKGHFVMEREMTFALSELLDPNSKQPSLEVKETLSDFYPTYEEAKKFRDIQKNSLLPILSNQTGNGAFAGFPREVIQLILSKQFG